MTKLTDLLPRAADIRDATEEHENTSLRVGGFLVTFVQALIDSMPAIQIEGNSLEYRVSEDNFVISMKMRNDDATEVPINITIPAATIQKAGLMTAQDKIALGNAYVKPEGGIPDTDLSEELQKSIDNVGKVADGSVTESKLSIGVKNTLNTAFDRATIANTLITNFNRITAKRGAVNNDGTVYYGTSYCSHIALTGEGKLLLNDGYFISKAVFLDKDGVAMDLYGENLNIESLEFGEPDLSWLIEFRKSDNKAFNNEDLEKVIKNVSFNSIVWNEYSNLDNYNCIGEYIIRGERKRNTDNMPINNLGDVEAHLNVIADTIGENATQILTLLNVGGGDGNIYTRTRQDNTWGAWGKLQTNVEVGVISQQQMDALVDNGIYSGVLSATEETFVLVVINNYAIATQAGYGGYISQLKYSVDLDGVVKLETRRRDAYDSWSDWKGIGGYTLPVATADVLGGVKVTKDVLNASGLRVDDGQLSLNQGGIKCIVPALDNINDVRLLNIREGGIYTGGLEDGDNLYPFTLVVSYNLEKGGANGLDFILQQLTYVKDGNIITLNRMLSANESDNTQYIEWQGVDERIAQLEEILTQLESRL